VPGRTERGESITSCDAARVHIFDAIESEIRNYCRNWPVVFDRGVGSWLYDEHGRPPGGPC
jgi:hypothetical protein